MSSLSDRIMEHAEALPEATPICPADLLYLGSRSAVSHALSRLTRSEKLDRICRGIYMRTFETRFGIRGPDLPKAIASLSKYWGVTIVPSGGAAANCLGLTTQNQIRLVFLTSGPSRWLLFGKCTVELRHAPQWQLIAPYRKPGEVVRALGWLGPNEAMEGLEAVLPKLSDEERMELAAAADRKDMPVWLAETINSQMTHAQNSFSGAIE